MHIKKTIIRICKTKNVCTYVSVKNKQKTFYRSSFYVNFRGGIKYKEKNYIAFNFSTCK